METLLDYQSTHQLINNTYFSSLDIASVLFAYDSAAAAYALSLNSAFYNLLNYTFLSFRKLNWTFASD